MHVFKLGSPWTRWRRHVTAKLQHFLHAHEVHDEHYVFVERIWKIAVEQRQVWIARMELIDGRTGRHLFLVRGNDKNEVIHVTNEAGRVERTLLFGDAKYGEYFDLLTRGGGKDPFVART